jgi:hypothetical protein
MYSVRSLSGALRCLRGRRMVVMSSTGCQKCGGSIPPSQGRVGGRPKTRNG